MIFHIFARGHGRERQWYWHLKSANGKIIANGEGYKRRKDACDAVGLVKSAYDAEVRVEGRAGPGMGL
jgi:uncharacterized protein YegP (UPF0339 family)